MTDRIYDQPSDPWTPPVRFAMPSAPQGAPTTSTTTAAPITVPAHVMQSFLAPLLAVLGEPSTPDPDRFLAEYGRELSMYSAAELSKAASVVMRSHKGPARWPRLADCVDACNDARERVHASRPAHRGGVSIETWEARLASAERQIVCPMGLTAAREGWVLGLRDFVVANNRLPNGHEIERIRDTARHNAACADGTIDMGQMACALIPFARTRAKRQAAIASRIETAMAGG